MWYIYIYIYIYVHMYACAHSLHIHIYVYIYICMYLTLCIYICCAVIFRFHASSILRCRCSTSVIGHAEFRKGSHSTMRKPQLKPNASLKKLITWLPKESKAVSLKTCSLESWNLHGTTPLSSEQSSLGEGVCLQKAALLLSAKAQRHPWSLGSREAA